MTADYMDIAREHLRRQQQPDALDPNEAVGDALKGHAVLFVGDDGEDMRCWIVADQEDAEALRRSGVEPVDVVLDRQEVRALVAVDDPAILAEILRFKRELPAGRFTRDRM